MPKICLDAGHFGNNNWNPNVTPIYWESRMAWKLHLMLKEELEKYGFTVIVTRTDEEKDLALMARGQKAKGCDLFLSLHSNACNSESVDRVVCIYPVSEVKKDLALALVQTVTEVMQTHDAPNTYYKWNSTHDADYYGVIRGAVSVGVPGLILEHSFHTNNRAANWLNVDSNLRKLAVAEAKLLAQHYGMQPQPTGLSEADVKALIEDEIAKVKESLEEFAAQKVTERAQEIEKKFDNKFTKVSKELSKAYDKALTTALTSVTNTAEGVVTARVGQMIGHLEDIPSTKVKQEFLPLLEHEFIDGGTPKEEDKTDIGLPWSVVRSLVVAKRYVDARIAELMIEDAENFECGDACKIEFPEE